MSSKLKEVIDMKEKGGRKEKNPYKIGLIALLGIVVLVGLYFGFSAVQDNAFQQGAITASNEVVQRINADQEIPLIVGEEGNQSVQWTGIGQVCSAMLQQQQQAAQQGGETQTMDQQTVQEGETGTETETQ